MQGLKSLAQRALTIVQGADFASRTLAATMLLRPHRLSRFVSCLLLAGACSLVQSAELGEPLVRSHIGQNLIADIELTGMPDPAVPVLVRPAHPDIYRGANIAMAPLLAHLQLSVMRRDGRQFLHVVSTRPVQADHVTMFLELSDGRQRHVRALTLWLTPDPHPAPPPAPVALPFAPVIAPKSLPVAPPQPIPPAPKPAVAVKPAAPPTQAPLPKPAPAPLPPTPRVLAAPAACPVVNSGQLRTCAALDYKNGVLQARIVELEEKVKALQVAIDGRPVAAPVPAAKVVKPVQPVMPKPKKQKERFPWLLAAGGVAGIAALGALVVYLRRKKAMLKGEPPRPGMLARLKSRFRRAKKPVAAPVEPVAH